MVFRLVVQEQVARRFIEQPIVAVRLAQPVIEVEVFTAREDAPFSNSYHGWRNVVDVAIH